MNGTLIAAIFTVGGFAFFGKNLYNVPFILLGVYLYSVIQKEKFSKNLLIAFFGTALSPLVSQISFGFGDPSLFGIFKGIFPAFCGFDAAFLGRTFCSNSSRLQPL
jgi:hypothetical protein